MGTTVFNSTAQHKKSRSRSNTGTNRRGEVKIWEVGWVWMLLVSVAGGVTLVWWEYAYHPNYRQLWMVPFGLILLVTPLITWLSVIVSDLCSLNQEEHEDEDEDDNVGVDKNKHPSSLIPIGV